MNYQLTSTQTTSLKSLGGFRSPKRISITVSHGVYERLMDRSDVEGRSLSNLASFILELGVSNQPPVDRTR